MSCYRPIHAVRSEAGEVFLARPARAAERDAFLVPCGVCIGCRLDHARKWAVRCTHEAATWSSSYFVTLTYDDQQLPKYGSLVKSDLQRFMKRLRKALRGDALAPDGSGRSPIRFFACGEYGDKTMRPHYHALLFNVRFPDLKKSSVNTFRSEMLGDVWKEGHHEIGAVTPASAAYVAGYSVKKVRRRKSNSAEVDEKYGVVDDETGEFVVRDSEFLLSSRRPGVGRFWLDRFAGDLKQGYVMHGGAEVGVPRYYRKRLAEVAADYADMVAFRAWQRAQELPLEERTAARLEDKEEVAVRKLLFNMAKREAAL